MGKRVLEPDKGNGRRMVKSLLREIGHRHGYEEYVEGPEAFVNDIHAIMGDHITTEVVVRASTALRHIVRVVYSHQRARHLRIRGSRFLDERNKVCDFLRSILISLGVEESSSLVYGWTTNPLTMALWFTVIWEQMEETGEMRNRALGLITQRFCVRATKRLDVADTLIVLNYLVFHGWHLYAGIGNVAEISSIIATRWRTLQNNPLDRCGRLLDPEGYLLPQNLSTYQSFRGDLDLFHIQTTEGLNLESEDTTFEEFVCEA